MGGGSSVELKKIELKAEQEKNRHKEKMKELEIEEKRMRFLEKLLSGDISIADLLKLLHKNPNMFKEMGMREVGDAFARLVETLQPRPELMAKLVSDNTPIADFHKNPNMFKEMGMKDGAAGEALENALSKLELEAGTGSAAKLAIQAASSTE